MCRCELLEILHAFEDKSVDKEAFISMNKVLSRFMDKMRREDGRAWREDVASIFSQFSLRVLPSPFF